MDFKVVSKKTKAGCPDFHRRLFTVTVTEGRVGEVVIPMENNNSVRERTRGKRVLD